jgi:arabinose-5-phosphate isomerase
MSQYDNFIACGKEVIKIEQDAIQNLSQSIDDNFAKACELILSCEGRVVVTGMGKSGHIASKIAATLASTGTPAFFVHPGEANHGDLGMITPKDTVIALSNSGETEELTNLLPVIKRLNVPLISLTNNPNSSLSQFANIDLYIRVDKEACPMNLAPTASTTASLVMGDAIAVALLKAKGFTEDDFALSHPGGSLGKRLLLKVADIMHKEDEIPSVSLNTPVSHALIEISEKRLGPALLTQKENLQVYLPMAIYDVPLKQKWILIILSLSR